MPDFWRMVTRQKNFLKTWLKANQITLLTVVLKGVSRKSADKHTFRKTVSGWHSLNAVSA